MRVMPLVAMSMLLLAGLSGCAGSEASTGSDETFDDFEAEPLAATSSTGVIRGVVVDSSISPIADVNVTLVGTGRHTMTDEAGRFGFSDVEPGIYFLQTQKAGFGDVQQSVEVVAGVDKPPITRMLAERIPGTEPMVTPLHIEGLMVCSTQVAIVFATGCMVGAYTGDHSRNYFDVAAPPTFMQTELTWTSTQLLAAENCMRNYASTNLGGTSLNGDTCGPSPRVMRTDQARLEETSVGAGKGVENVVWVAPLAAGGVPVLGLAIDQRFDVYVHIFENWTPEEDWLFIDDGPPTPPS